MYSLAMKPLAVLAVKPHLASAVFLAAGSISQALGQAGGIINAFALIGAFAGLVFAGWAAWTKKFLSRSIVFRLAERE
jgi:hypothetical protein